MIVKELDPFPSTADPRERAGRVAEEQMAFYLRRAFVSEKEVHVLHGLRLEHAGDAAQIDHLVLHRWGMLLIESKSVTTRVRVHAQGEWMRWQAGDWYGMRSPVSQVELQAEFLRARLREHTSALLDKLLGLQVQFGRMPLDTFVAISDEGIIERDGIERDGGVLLRVYKADQVCSQVKSLLATYRKANSPLGLWTSKEEYFWHKLTTAETTRILEFLCQQHRPLHTADTPAIMQPFASIPSRRDEDIPSRPPRTSLLPLSKGGPVQDKADEILTDQLASAEFNPANNPASVSGIVSASATCAVCGHAVSVGVARYCREHPGRFGTRIYCMTCQRSK